MKRAHTQSQTQEKKLAALTTEASKINARIAGILEAMEKAEGRQLKKLSTIRNPKARVALLDASLLTELQMLIEKLRMSRTPQNIDAILKEIVLFLFKITWKLFYLQGMEPPAIDPRLYPSD